MRRSFLDITIGLLLVAVGIAGRLLPHAPNFTPVAGAALFAGYYFRDRRVALLVPLVTMLISDMFIGAYEWPVMVAVYGALLAPVALRAIVGRNAALARVGVASLAASVLFFVLTNGAVWASSGMYPINLGGLTACYAAGVPFFKYTLAGDLTWSLSFFAVYAVAKRAVRSLDWHPQSIA